MVTLCSFDGSIAKGSCPGAPIDTTTKDTKVRRLDMEHHPANPPCRSCHHIQHRKTSQRSRKRCWQKCLVPAKVPRILKNTRVLRPPLTRAASMNCSGATMLQVPIVAHTWPISLQYGSVSGRQQTLFWMSGCRDSRSIKNVLSQELLGRVIPEPRHCKMPRRSGRANTRTCRGPFLRLRH